MQTRNCSEFKRIYLSVNTDMVRGYVAVVSGRAGEFQAPGWRLETLASRQGSGSGLVSVARQGKQTELAIC